MATRKKPVKKTLSVIARKGVSKPRYIKRPSQSTRKTPTKRLKKRRTENKVGSGRFPNPTSQQRATVAAEWGAWANSHGVPAAKIRDGAYAIQAMPDPTRIKNFSSLAQTLGMRMANPRKKKTLTKALGGGGNFAVVIPVRGNMWKVSTWHRTQDLAVSKAEDVANRTNKPVRVMTRAKVNSLLVH